MKNRKGNNENKGRSRAKRSSQQFYTMWNRAQNWWISGQRWTTMTNWSRLASVIWRPIEYVNIKWIPVTSSATQCQSGAQNEHDLKGPIKQWTSHALCGCTRGTWITWSIKDSLLNKCTLLHCEVVCYTYFFDIFSWLFSRCSCDVHHTFFLCCQSLIHCKCLIHYKLDIVEKGVHIAWHATIQHILSSLILKVILVLKHALF